MFLNKMVYIDERKDLKGEASSTSLENTLRINFLKAIKKQHKAADVKWPSGNVS